MSATLSPPARPSPRARIPNAPAGLSALWRATPPATRVFQPATLARYPEPARRYLAHALAPGTPLASAVRLKMHGAIRLRGWCPFRAEQVNTRAGGFVWRATVWMGGLPITGFDRYLEGEGAMDWKMLGLFPVMHADGPEVSRSALGRLAAEAIWLPSLLTGTDVTWEATDAGHPRASFRQDGEPIELTLTVDDRGRALAVRLPRWGNPDGEGWRFVDFGGFLEEERTFGGYTIPTRVRVGWHVGSERFLSEGEFFRASISRAEFR